MMNCCLTLIIIFRWSYLNKYYLFTHKWVNRIRKCTSKIYTIQLDIPKETNSEEYLTRDSMWKIQIIQHIVIDPIANAPLSILHARTWNYVTTVIIVKCRQSIKIRNYHTRHLLSLESNRCQQDFNKQNINNKK